MSLTKGFFYSVFRASPLSVVFKNNQLTKISYVEEATLLSGGAIFQYSLVAKESRSQI